MKRLIMIVLIVLSGRIGSVKGQAGDEHPIITSENAHRLVEVGMFGKGYVADLAWMSNDQTLIVAATTGLWFYDMDAPNQVSRHIQQNPGGGDLILNGDNTQLIEVNSEAVQVWDLRTGTVLSSYDITSLHFRWYLTTADSYKAGFDAEGRPLLAMVEKERLIVVDLLTGEQLYTFDKDIGWERVMFDAAGQIVIHTEDAWSPAAPNWPERIYTLLSPDGKYLAGIMGEETRVLKIWARMEGRELWSMSFESPRHLSLTWSQDNQRLAIMSDSGTHIWDHTQNAVIAHNTLSFTHQAAMFSSDSRTLLRLGYKSEDGFSV